MNNGRIKVVRKLLDSLWEKATLRGSTSWGRKKENNSYSGVNLTMVIGKEAVIVSEGPHGKLIIHEFRETGDTVLGRRVGEILAKAGLSFIKNEPRPAKTLEMVAREALLTSDCLWYCPICKLGDAIDITLDSDYQSALKKGYEKHEAISPDCKTSRVKIYQLVDGRLTELAELHMIAGAKRAK